jgi:hypothetical protein
MSRIAYLAISRKNELHLKKQPYSIGLSFSGLPVRLSFLRRRPSALLPAGAGSLGAVRSTGEGVPTRESHHEAAFVQRRLSASAADC